MKQKCFRALLLAVAFIAVFQPAFSRGKSEGNEKERQEMMESILKYKRDFIIKRLDLSREQQNNFIPLYEDMSAEIAKVNADTRDIEARINRASTSDINDLDYEMATNAMIEKGQKISDIEKKYYQRFAEILSPKQLFLLKTSDQEINRKFLDHIRKKKHE